MALRASDAAALQTFEGKTRQTPMRHCPQVFDGDGPRRVPAAVKPAAGTVS
jgi:hypothetical protein